MLTLCGLTLVFSGLLAILQEKYGLGLLLVAIGRASDIADGWVADHTKTKSPLGEALDAGADKLTTLATIVVFFAAHIAPLWLLTLLLLPHVIISVLAMRAHTRHYALHPSGLGKISMILVWLSLLGLMMQKAFELNWNGSLMFGSYGTAGLSICLGLVTALRYMKELRR